MHIVSLVFVIRAISSAYFSATSMPGFAVDLHHLRGAYAESMF